MKLLVIADLEGVAGVTSYQDHCDPAGRYFAVARELATLELNAAIEGAVASGVRQAEVLDGHGAGGVDERRLDSRAGLFAASGMAYPFNVNGSFSAAVFVGHHAKSGTAHAQFPHTGSFGVVDYSVNGRSLGEVGKNILLCSYFGVRTVMVSGTAGACREARELIAGVETVVTSAHVSDEAELAAEDRTPLVRNGEFVHLLPEVARLRIAGAARRAIGKAGTMPLFWLPPPYEAVTIRRRWFRKRVVRREDDLIRLFNA